MLKLDTNSGFHELFLNFVPLICFIGNNFYHLRLWSKYCKAE